MIFPKLFASEKFSNLDSEEEGDISVPLYDKATIIQFYYSLGTSQEMENFLLGFGTPIKILNLNNGETIGITLVEELHREYATVNKTKDHGKFTFTGEDGVISEEQSSIQIGPYGQYCYGVLHGTPQEHKNA